MWSAALQKLHPVLVFSGVAILSTLSTQYVFSPRSEIASELICWIILPSLFPFARRPDFDAKSPFGNLWTQATSSWSLWVVTFGLAIASLYRAEYGSPELYPLLTLLLLAAQKYMRSDEIVVDIIRSWLYSPHAWATVIVALFTSCALSAGSLPGALLSIVAVVAHMIVYVSLIPRPANGSRWLPLINDFEGTVASLAWRVRCSLAVTMIAHAMVYGFTKPDITSALLMGFTKAVSWYSMTQMTRHASWVVASAIGTFAIASTTNPFIQTFETHAVSHVVASLCALFQIVYMIPKRVKARYILWGFSLIPLASYTLNTWIRSEMRELTQMSARNTYNHPVQALTREAKVKFDYLVQNQSRNFTAAYAEYERRYGVEPPRGFEDWYEFASLHQSPIIDDFDSIYQSVAPFWKLSGQEVASITEKIYNRSGSEVWQCRQDSNITGTACNHPSRKRDRSIKRFFETLIDTYNISLPGIRILVNHFDEPRVLLPPQSNQDQEDNHFGRYKLTKLSHQSTWDTITTPCIDREPDSMLSREPRADTYGLPFVTNHAADMDLCQHPEYQSMHGIFMCPTTFRLVEGWVPILSAGSPSTMGDIIYPSPAYIENGFQYSEEHDFDWEDKHNNLYWAGSTTGGYSQDDTWRSYHRQRFVALAQNIDQRQHTYLGEKRGIIQHVKSSFLNSRLFDVYFTRMIQCKPKQCRDQSFFFRTKSWASKHQAYHSRLAFDTDGNGISGRYYQLLASKSVPLKQTLLREWHDDRLVPWVHYIPVSQNMEELPELVSHLSFNEEGQKRAKEIADQGREWFQKAFREVDLSIYMYRLLLELARLQDPERAAIQGVEEDVQEAM
ncbi:glycosyltransferase family 90 protein [Corynespora cassiicola Philippines]|uniref:Glycosyltransferase family 90 protein n=1 Tax=Corynespora cassiicola Philippines TaxID=1448308 RepID=A0A2T2NH47_CORCC|nr:glycosyltransferase family 90 protein [Corynespora cassiicola Philippines]